jgi:hypothetical protein
MSILTWCLYDMAIWCIFLVLLGCTKKNLATLGLLHTNYFCSNMYDLFQFFFSRFFWATVRGCLMQGFPVRAGRDRFSWSTTAAASNACLRNRTNINFRQFTARPAESACHPAAYFKTLRSHRHASVSLHRYLRYW